VATSISSDAVVSEALSWVGTPWHHAADVKGLGVDCAMLIVRCFVDSGILKPFDPRPYPPDWYLHHKEERFLEWVEKFGVRRQPDEPDCPGDVRLYQWGLCISHGAIVVGDGTMVHADRIAKKVVRSELSYWSERYIATYRIAA
jgi:NlpC/P60 family putative phage cell wall peptidase